MRYIILITALSLLTCERRSVAKSEPRCSDPVPVEDGIEYICDGKPLLVGKQGPPGKDGKNGQNGSPGPEGPKGEPGSGSGPKGDTGPAGPPGRDGNNGAPGPKGDRGDNGRDGAPGAQGPKGRDGISGRAVDKITSCGFNLSTSPNQVIDATILKFTDGFIDLNLKLANLNTGQLSYNSFTYEPGTTELILNIDVFLVRISGHTTKITARSTGF